MSKSETNIILGTLPENERKVLNMCDVLNRILTETTAVLPPTDFVSLNILPSFNKALIYCVTMQSNFLYIHVLYTHTHNTQYIVPLWDIKPLRFKKKYFPSRLNTWTFIPQTAENLFPFYTILFTLTAMRSGMRFYKATSWFCFTLPHSIFISLCRAILLSLLRQMTEHQAL